MGDCHRYGRPRHPEAPSCGCHVTKDKAEARGGPQDPEAAKAGLTPPQGGPRPDPPAPASFLLPRAVSSAGSSPPPTPKLTLSGSPSPGPPTAAAPGLARPLFTKAFLPPPQVRLSFSPFLEPPGRPLGRTSVPGPPGWSALQ